MARVPRRKRMRPRVGAAAAAAHGALAGNRVLAGTHASARMRSARGVRIRRVEAEQVLPYSRRVIARTLGVLQQALLACYFFFQQHSRRDDLRHARVLARHEIVQPRRVRPRFVHLFMCKYICKYIYVSMYLSIDR